MIVSQNFQYYHKKYFFRQQLPTTAMIFLSQQLKTIKDYFLFTD